MKLLVFFVLVASCRGSIFRQIASERVGRALEGIIIRPRALLDGVNETLQEIINDFNDPAVVEEVDLEVPESLKDIFSGWLNLTNLKAEGQKHLKVPLLRQVILGGIGVNLSLSLENLELTTKYLIDLAILPFLFPIDIKGSGNFSFHLEDLTLDISTRLNTTFVEGNDDVVVILFGTRIEINFGEKTEVSIADDTTGLGGLVALALNGILREIEDDPIAFSDSISPIVEDIVNDILLGAQGVPVGTSN